ncbi:hypothetical protein K1719_014994 [Acacia pycnantha]|nr:hypothetical protein K1719_014994 [Acacia pycnantha]
MVRVMVVSTGKKKREKERCPQCSKKCALRDVRKLYAARVFAADEELHKVKCLREQNFPVLLSSSFVTLLQLIQMLKL